VKRAQVRDEGAEAPRCWGYSRASVQQTTGLLPGRQVEAKAELVTVRLAELVSEVKRHHPA
jgi:hypothetical protein